MKSKHEHHFRLFLLSALAEHRQTFEIRADNFRTEDAHKSYNVREEATSAPICFLCGFSSLFVLKFGDAGFCGGRKTRVPREKPSEKVENNNKLNPNMWLSTLMLPPLRHPCPPRMRNTQRHWSGTLGKTTKHSFIYGDEAIENAIALYLKASKGPYLRDLCTEPQHH